MNLEKLSLVIPKMSSATGYIQNQMVRTSQTKRQFKDRLAEHRDYPKRDVLTEPSGEHFTKRGHNVAHLKGLVLEKVRNADPFILKAREHLLIRKFDSFHHGLNQEA